MKTKQRTMVILFLVISLMTLGCGAEQLFGLTPTPYPTLTPYPTYTPLPERWNVRVISAEASLEYGTWYIPEDGKNRFVIVIIEYTYLGQGRAEFSPESVVLINTSTQGFVGWAKTPELYQAEGSSQIVDFTEDSLANNVDSGETKTEVFVWEFPKTYTDFRLFFPEAEAIDITLSR